jgi:hypothetical protein
VRSRSRNPLLLLLAVCEPTYQLVCMLTTRRSQEPSIDYSAMSIGCSSACNPQFHSLSISGFHSWKILAARRLAAAQSW